jgi:3-methyladenine DNA glycosylase Tag
MVNPAIFDDLRAVRNNWKLLAVKANDDVKKALTKCYEDITNVIRKYERQIPVRRGR